MTSHELFTLQVNIDESQPEGSVLQRAAKYESEATSPTKRMRDPAELPLSERMALFEKNKGPLLVPKVPFSTPMPAKLLKESEQSMLRVCFKLKIKVDL